MTTNNVRQNNSSTKETKPSNKKNPHNYDPDVTNNDTCTTVKTETWQAADATLNIREHQAIQDPSIIKSAPRA